MTLLLSLTTTALAAWPDDVVLSDLDQYNGERVTNTRAAGDGYEEVVRELGFAIANKPLAPGETLGVNGFDLSVYNTFAFITDEGTQDAPSGWERTHTDNDPSPVLWIPWVGVRKGLPLSLEAGLNFGYIGFSRQTAIGGYGRWAVVEGYRNAPDLTVQVGYTGYVGNEELELGVMDVNGTLGYTLPFGTLVGINSANFAPYIGAGFVRVRAAPRLSPDEQEELGIGTVSGFNTSDDYKEGFSPFTTHIGFRVLSGDFQVKVAGAFAPRVIPSLSFGIGFEY